MIIDAIGNLNRYVSLHPSFDEAFEYITTTDLANIAIGTYILEEGVLKAIFSDQPGKTKAESLEKFECHNRYIDIQVCISGEEQIGWKPRHDCHSPKGEYNNEKDVLFFNDEPDMFFTLRPGQFVIFFSEDVHAPMIGDGNIRKLVMKVKV
ncbi:MAG: YhcH/YjgK/YiaL family protein [Niabella sp.]